MDSYNLLIFKRGKLKVGATTFVFKRLFYGEWLISEWFELEFISQTSPYESRKGVERTLAVLEWSWDFKTILILGISLTTIFNYYSAKLGDFYSISIAGGFEPKVVRCGLENIFELTNKPFSSFGFEYAFNCSSLVVDVAMHLNLF